MNVIMKTNLISAVQYAMDAHKTALVSFLSINNMENKYDTEHIGSGFFYTSESGAHLLVTANHVIEQLGKNTDNYCSILLGKDNNGKDFYYFYSISKLKFYTDLDSDIAYCVLDKKFLSEIYHAMQYNKLNLRMPKAFVSTIVDGGKVEDEYVFGFHSSNNVRKLKFQNYKRNSRKYQIRRVYDVSKDVSTLTSIKNPIFLYFDKKNMLSVDDNDFVKTDFQITSQYFVKEGNSPDWAGMSGSPYISVYTTANDKLCLRVSGVLVEHLYTPPANGRYLVVSSLENMAGVG